MWCQRPTETPQLRRLLEIITVGDSVEVKGTLRVGAFFTEYWPIISEALRHTSNETAEKILRDAGGEPDPNWHISERVARLREATDISRF